jgi:amino acid permease
MQCLGEMVTWLPLLGATPTFATRYVDGALGFTIPSAISSANAYLYSGSRYIMSLAQSDLAPKNFLHCSKNYVHHSPQLPAQHRI